MTEAEALDMAARAAGWRNWRDAEYFWQTESTETDSIRAHAKTLMENAALKAENERLRGMLKPRWFYAGEDQSSDQCRFSIDEVLEYELWGWGPPKPGRHVVHVSTALPGPDIWVAVHVFTDEEKDERGDDETWSFEQFSTEAEARAALKEIDNGDR